MDATESARSLGTISTIAFGAGGVLVVGGAVLYLTAPRMPSTGIHVVPSAGPRHAGLALGGSF